MMLVIVGPPGAGKKRLAEFLWNFGIECKVVTSEAPTRALSKKCDRATLFVGEFIAPREPHEEPEPGGNAHG